MSQRYFRVGSIYGSRWFNAKIYARFGLEPAKRLPSWPIVSGDTVQVIEGPEKGKIGQVLAVKRKTNQIVIKDVNMHVRTKRATPVRGGFFYKTESPIHYTNVQLVDPVQNKPTKIHFAKDLAGNNVRVSNLSGAIIPKPQLNRVVPDRAKKMNKTLDTRPEIVWQVTYKPIQRGVQPKALFNYQKTPLEIRNEKKEELFQKYKKNRRQPHISAGY